MITVILEWFLYRFFTLFSYQYDSLIQEFFTFALNIKKIKMKRSLVLATAIVACSIANAQEKNHKFFNDWSIQATLNHNFLGGNAKGLHTQETEEVNGTDVDMNYKDEFDLGFGVRLAKQLSPVFDLGLEYSGMTFTGSKTTKKDAPYTVMATEVDFSLLALSSRVSLSRMSEHLGRQPKVNFFAEAGAGLLWGEATTFEVVADASRLGDKETHGTDRMGAAFLGAGLDWKFANRLSLTAATKLYTTRGGDLDGLGGSRNDNFIISSIGLNFDLSSREEGSKGYKWNNSFADMSSSIAKNASDIENISSKLSNIDERFSKVESDLANKVDKKAWKDSDGDGVHNDDDREPNTPKGQLVNFQGKAIVAGGTGDVNFTPVYFNTSSSTVGRNEYIAIANIALYLQEHTDAKVSLLGYADKRGSDSFNMKLSDKRTSAVEKILVDQFGIDASRVSTESKGESKLLSKLDRVNRRVDFAVKK